MIRAFSVLGDTGAADPSALAGNISVALLSTFYSLIIAVPAFVFLVFAIVRYNRLPKRS
jgi:biopolymer transport protein ExbB